MLNGIDVASYQTGLDPAVVPCDFVIVKATQGTTYKNPDFQRWCFCHHSSDVPVARKSI
jgi:hypothetical protein